MAPSPTNSTCAISPHPNPCCALAAASELGPGAPVTIVAPRRPRPLLMELAQLGFDAEPEAPAADGSVRVRIHRPCDDLAAA